MLTDETTGYTGKNNPFPIHFYIMKCLLYTVCMKSILYNHFSQGSYPSVEFSWFLAGQPLTPSPQVVKIPSKA